MESTMQSLAIDIRREELRKKLADAIDVAKDPQSTDAMIDAAMVRLAEAYADLQSRKQM